MIVLSWSNATRDLLKSFSWGIGALRQLFASDDGAISFGGCPIASLCWTEPDSNLYGAFPVKWLFWVLLRVLCSERESRSSSRRLRSGSRSARKGSRDRNASIAWRLAA